MNAPTLPNRDAAPGPNPNTGIGGNSPPPFDPIEVADLAATADAFLNACDIWRTTEIDSDDLAEQLTDQIAGLRANKKAVDEARKAAKKPHDDAGKAVQEAYTPILTRYERALKVMLDKAGAWLDRKRAEAEAQRRREREEAERQAEEARRMAMDAAATDSIDDQIAAEEAAKAAEKAMKAAARDVKVNVGSASGAGRTVSTRTRKEVEITNVRVVFMRYQDRPEVAEVLHRLATAEANSKGFEGDIPGTTITTKTVAV